MLKTIDYKDDKVIILDQRKLPFKINFIKCSNYKMVAECIKNLSIRGAPAIGIATAMGIALGAQDIKANSFDIFMKKIQYIFDYMLSTRPTAVNIRWAIERIKDVLIKNKDLPIPKLKQLLIGESRRILREDIETNKLIGKWGSEFIKDGDTILTHCNAGSLATGGYGTATAPMFIAKEQGKKIKIIIDETRPVLQGARLTAWELLQHGFQVTLITDSTAGALMKRGEIDLVIVGTDRTTRNGDVANKIGTYSLAVLCKENKIPFYVAAPLSSIDFTIKSGDAIPIEERDGKEVTHIFGKYQIAPDKIKVRNLAFDVTPHKYVTAFFTEKGVFRPKDIKKLSNKNIKLEDIRLKP